MARKDPNPSFSGLSCTARTSKRGGMGDGPVAIGRPGISAGPLAKPPAQGGVAAAVAGSPGGSDLACPGHTPPTPAHHRAERRARQVRHPRVAARRNLRRSVPTRHLAGLGDTPVPLRKMGTRRRILRCHGCTATRRAHPGEEARGVGSCPQSDLGLRGVQPAQGHAALSWVPDPRRRSPPARPAQRSPCRPAGNV